jgi:hypothetical protein
MANSLTGGYGLRLLLPLVFFMVVNLLTLAQRKQLLKTTGRVVTM